MSPNLISSSLDNFCRRICGVLFIAISFLVTSALAPRALAQTIDDNFIVRVQMKLCPEYPEGGVVFEVLYHIGFGTPPLQPDIVNLDINPSNNTATVDIRLPSTLGKTPFSIYGTCRNALGFSAPSNPALVSNCDALAIQDLDGDGLSNLTEDRDCSNFFSPGDYGDLFRRDSDGDNVLDGVEFASGTLPTNPASSPRPIIFKSGNFDPDGNGDSNPVVFRPSSGSWFIGDFFVPNNNIVVNFGQNGDAPVAYLPKGSTWNIGVVRFAGIDYQWLFNGPGFEMSDGSRRNLIQFGIFGDNLIPGPWQSPNFTNPAVARLFVNEWTFFIFQNDGTIRTVKLGGNGDVPKPQDYDGDGIFDIAIFRPSERKTVFIRSSDNVVETHYFGSGTADYSVSGDYTGDGIDEISFWEPITATFYSMKSDLGFDDMQAAAQNPNYYQDLVLGTYFVNVPLSWIYYEDKAVYTVVDHATGVRKFKLDNNSSNPETSIQWGLPGDSQG